MPPICSSKLGLAAVRIFLLAGCFIAAPALPASAQFLGFTASVNNPPPGNNGVMGATGAGSSGFLNTPANQALGLQANGLPTMNAVDVGMGDFNGDGISDIYALSADNSSGTGNANTVTLTIFPSVGDGTFGMPVNFSFTGQSVQPVGFAVRDIDGDGFADVAIAMTGVGPSGVAFQDVVLMLGKDLANAQPGAMVPSQNLPLSSTPVAVALGRLQSDAMGDIAVAEAPGVVEAFLHDPLTGSFTTPGATSKKLFLGVVLSTFAQLGYLTPRAIAIGQSNLSSPVATTPPGGNLDLFIAGQKLLNPSMGEVEILQNFDLSGPPFTITDFPAGSMASGVVTGDINGDGIPDMAFIDHANGSAGLYLGQDFFGFPGGYMPALVDSYGSMTDFPTSLAIMDFRGTGEHDLATVNQGTTPGNGKIKILTSNGPGGGFTLAATFTNPMSPTTCPTSVATGRFDVRSTADDIVWSDPGPCGPGGVIYLDKTNVGLALMILALPAAPTSTSVPVPQGPVVTGQPVSFTVHVTGVPAGTVVGLVDSRITLAGITVATGTTDTQGNATLAVTFSIPGVHRISAVCYQTSSIRGSLSSWVPVNVALGTPPPTISGISPSSGPVGSTVTINGNNFNGATIVKFGGVTAIPFTVDSNTQITAQVPPGGNGPVEVTTPGGTATSTSTFSVQPVINSFSPMSGPPGTMVTIMGSGFTGVTGVAFNGNAATTFTVLSDTSISVTVPANASTGFITVGTGLPNGTATSPATFTVVACPTITVTIPSLPLTVGQAISGTQVAVIASGGTPPYTFQAVLPPGLFLSPNSASSEFIQGIPTAAGPFTGSISVIDSNGCPGSATFTTVVNPSTTQTTLSSSTNSPIANHPFTTTATVTEVKGILIPTGTEEFDASGIGIIALVPLANGTAMATFTPKAAGLLTITGIYSGDPNNKSSSGNLTLTVSPDNTAGTLTILSNPGTYGQPNSLTATFTTVPPGAATVTGAVNLKIDGVLVAGGTLSSGTITFPLTNVPAGMHTVDVDYLGSSNFNASSVTATYQQLPSPTVTRVTSSQDPSNIGQGVQFTAKVAETNGGVNTATGNGQFLIDGLPFGAFVALVSRIATSPSTSTLPAGVHTITFNYNGDANHIASTGTLTQTVGEPNVTVKLTAHAAAGAGREKLTFVLTNTGPAEALSDGLTFASKALSGGGSLILDPSVTVPLTVGNLMPGATATVQVILDETGTVTRASLLVNQIYKDFLNRKVQSSSGFAFNVP